MTNSSSTLLRNHQKVFAVSTPSALLRHEWRVFTVNDSSSTLLRHEWRVFTMTNSSRSEYSEINKRCLQCTLLGHRWSVFTVTNSVSTIVRNQFKKIVLTVSTPSTLLRHQPKSLITVSDSSAHYADISHGSWSRAHKYYEDRRRKCLVILSEKFLFHLDSVVVGEICRWNVLLPQELDPKGEKITSIWPH